MTRRRRFRLRRRRSPVENLALSPDTSDTDEEREPPRVSSANEKLKTENHAAEKEGSLKISLVGDLAGPTSHLSVAPNPDVTEIGSTKSKMVSSDDDVHSTTWSQIMGKLDIELANEKEVEFGQSLPTNLVHHMENMIENDMDALQRSASLLAHDFESTEETYTDHSKAVDVMLPKRLKVRNKILKMIGGKQRDKEESSSSTSTPCVIKHPTLLQNDAVKQLTSATHLQADLKRLEKHQTSLQEVRVKSLSETEPSEASSNSTRTSDISVQSPSTIGSTVVVRHNYESKWITEVLVDKNEDTLIHSLKNQSKKNDTSYDATCNAVSSVEGSLLSGHSENHEKTANDKETVDSVNTRSYASETEEKNPLDDSTDPSTRTYTSTASAGAGAQKHRWSQHSSSRSATSDGSETSCTDADYSSSSTYSSSTLLGKRKSRINESQESCVLDKSFNAVGVDEEGEGREAASSDDVDDDGFSNGSIGGSVYGIVETTNMSTNAVRTSGGCHRTVCDRNLNSTDLQMMNCVNSSLYGDPGNSCADSAVELKFAEKDLLDVIARFQCNITDESSNCNDSDSSIKTCENEEDLFRQIACQMVKSDVAQKVGMLNKVKKETGSCKSWTSYKRRLKVHDTARGNAVESLAALSAHKTPPVDVDSVSDWSSRVVEMMEQFKYKEPDLDTPETGVPKAANNHKHKHQHQ